MSTVYTLALVGGKPRVIRSGVPLIDGRRDLDRGLAQVVVREKAHAVLEWGRCTETDRHALHAEIERRAQSAARRRITAQSVVCTTTPPCKTPGCKGAVTRTIHPEFAEFCLKCRNRIQAKIAKLRRKRLPVPPLTELVTWMVTNASAKVANNTPPVPDPILMDFPSTQVLERTMVELLVLASQYGGVHELRAAAHRGKALAG